MHPLTRLPPEIWYLAFQKLNLGELNTFAIAFNRSLLMGDIERISSSLATQEIVRIPFSVAPTSALCAAAEGSFRQICLEVLPTICLLSPRTDGKCDLVFQGKGSGYRSHPFDPRINWGGPRHIKDLELTFQQVGGRDSRTFLELRYSRNKGSEIQLVSLE